MKLTFPSVANVIGCFLVSLVASIVPGNCCQSPYTAWGVDEYELFGLTKEELSREFASRLFFSVSFDHANLLKNGTGLGYQGPTFKVYFSNGRVSSVQGIFEGCTHSYWRPRFYSRLDAVKYAIDGLSDTNEVDALEKARAALAELKSTLCVELNYLEQFSAYRSRDQHRKVGTTPTPTPRQQEQQVQVAKERSPYRKYGSIFSPI